MLHTLCSAGNQALTCDHCVVLLQTAGMETDDLQAQLSHLQQLIIDEEQKRQRQKVQTAPHSFVVICC